MDPFRMYSVFPRKGRKVWYVKYPDISAPGGWKSVATRWRLDEPQGKRRALAFAERMARDFKLAGGRRSGEAWGDWVRPYLDDRYRNSPKTHRSYTAAWELLRVYLHKEGVHVPAALNFNHVVGYMRWRSAQKRHSGKLISRNTAIQDLRTLSLVMREAVRRGYAQGNPAERTGIRRDPPKEKREFTDAEIATVRAALAKLEGQLPITARWRTVCWEIALHQGCRLTETQVPMDLVDEKRRTITFAGKGRNGVKRVFTTTLHEGLVPLMAELRAAGATVTCQLPKLPALAWHKFFRELKMEGVSFHCTRVTVITRLARSGVPEQQAMRYVHHASRVVHQVYQKLKTEDLSAVTAALRF